MLRQKPGENARDGLRIDKLAMKLYQSMIEGREQSSEQRKVILDTIQELALKNFQLGFCDDIALEKHFKLIVELLKQIVENTVVRNLMWNRMRMFFLRKEKPKSKQKSNQTRLIILKWLPVKSMLK